MINVSWSLYKHKQLKALGSKDSIIMEVLSRKYRKLKFGELNSLLESKTIEALNATNCKFSHRVSTSNLYEIFAEGIYKVPGFEPLPGQTVVDVGANIGDSAMWWSKAYGANVIAFEPLEDLFEILLENVALNNAPVKAYNVALGSGVVSRFKRRANMMVMGGDKSVVTHRLDDYNLKVLHILKIDVEGFEYEVLKGSIETLKRLRPKIILETHSKALRKECHKVLKKLDYRLRFKGRKIKSRNPGMDQVINLFYSHNST